MQLSCRRGTFLPGSNFVVQMDRALTLAPRMIAVLSPQYLSSLYTQPELLNRYKGIHALPAINIPWVWLSMGSRVETTPSTAH
jgi:hypothetical protein